MSKQQGSFSFEIHYTKSAEKFFSEHEDVREEYKNSLFELLCGEHPERVDVKRIKGKRNAYYRVRLGSYRVIYTIIDEKVVVIKTIIAGSRGDVYKKIDGLK